MKSRSCPLLSEGWQIVHQIEKACPQETLEIDERIKAALDEKTCSRKLRGVRIGLWDKKGLLFLAFGPFSAYFYVYAHVTVVFVK